MRPYFMVGKFLRVGRLSRNYGADLVGQALLPVRMFGGAITLDSQEWLSYYCARACSCCCTCFFSACMSSGERNVIRATFLVREYGMINCIAPLCSRMEK